MPLYNSERYLAEALDSLLAQDHRDFELIMSDNGPSDAPESICRDYAAHDTRIRYHRTEDNLGAVWNFNRVFELAKGDYFMWAAHDDVRAPGCVSRSLAALEARPDAVLCCTGVSFIDEAGREIEPLVDLEPPVSKTLSG